MLIASSFPENLAIRRVSVAIAFSVRTNFFEFLTIFNIKFFPFWHLLCAKKADLFDRLNRCFLSRENLTSCHVVFPNNPCLKFPAVFQANLHVTSLVMGGLMKMGKIKARVFSPGWIPYPVHYHFQTPYWGFWKKYGVLMKFLFFSFSAFLSNTIFSYTKRQNVKLLFFYLKYVFPFVRLTHFPTMSFLHNKKVKTLRIHFSAFFSLFYSRLSCLPQLHLIKIAMIYFTRWFNLWSLY